MYVLIRAVFCYLFEKFLSDDWINAFFNKSNTLYIVTPLDSYTFSLLRLNFLPKLLTLIGFFYINLRFVLNIV